MIYVKTRVGDRPLTAAARRTAATRPGAGSAPAPQTGARRWTRLARWPAGLGAALLLAGITTARAQPREPEGQPQRLEAIALQAGMHRIRAEVAITPEQRQKGLMYRRDLGTHEGMLFVFEYPMTQCFWMKNTPTPLSIAFLADDGTVVNLADMQPLSEQSHCSTKAVRYVLEMNQGWFAKRGIKAGFKIGGAPFDKR